VTSRFDFEAARRAGQGIVRRTPLLPAMELSERLGVDVRVKAECLQVTGSFKVRGAASRLVAFTPDERARGVIACSSGNHGRAVAFVAARLGIPATVYVPRWVDPVKLEGIRAQGAEAVLAGETFDEAEALAVADAERSGRPYVSAYDDPWVIAGQGTLAGEILDQLGEAPSAVLAPLSGGGLLGGIAAALRDRLGAGRTRCVGVSAINAAVMHASIRVGRPVTLPERETLANALAGGIGLDNRHSFGLVRGLVGDHVMVDEPAIAGAMSYCARRLRLVVEGGGAVALAALVDGVWRPADGQRGPVVVVLSGGNVSMDVLVRVLGTVPGTAGVIRGAAPAPRRFGPG
jgi:threonine dehydratase